MFYNARVDLFSKLIEFEPFKAKIYLNSILNLDKMCYKECVLVLVLLFLRFHIINIIKNLAKNCFVIFLNKKSECAFNS